jgi:hypothetical protein
MYYKRLEMNQFKNHSEIPNSVQDFIMSFADVMFITEIPLEEINEWLAEHHEAFKFLGGVYD